jgi:hypothetical protein
MATYYAVIYELSPYEFDWVLTAKSSPQTYLPANDQVILDHRQKSHIIYVSHDLFHKGKRSPASAFFMLTLQWSVRYSSIVIISFMFNLPI